MRVRVRAAAAPAAHTALVLLVGTAVFVTVRDDPTPAPTTTTTTTTTTTVPLAAITDAIATSLQGSLEVPISRGEATCVATALMAVLPPDELDRLDPLPAPLAALTEPQRNDLVRAVVQCVPPATAEAILGSGSRPAPPVELPDEGT
jgi:hypothetical protein